MFHNLYGKELKKTIHSCRAHPARSSSPFPPTSLQTSAASSLPTPFQKVKAAPADHHLPPTPDVRTRQPPPRATPHTRIAAQGPEPAAAPAPAPGPPNTNKKSRGGRGAACVVPGRASGSLPGPLSGPGPRNPQGRGRAEGRRRANLRPRAGWAPRGARSGAH